MNILIIDDNKYITDSISIFAESKGYFCKISNDGKKVCNLALTENFNLILLDIAMPEFSGYDALDTLKNDSNFDMKKIVIITASNLDSV
ncbi:MAG: response regulator [Thaumarchaeota archaeon]|nr:response regulator [Nitrososphaerota archaeon]